MTHRATYTKSGADNQQAPSASLVDAIEAHNAAEIVSFHTPGHKGKPLLDLGEQAYRLDVTELPGLDDLSRPDGVLASLQQRCASVWNAQESFISVNGASAALIAAMLASAHRGGKVALAANCHRSAVHALVLSGLQPLWLQPQWLADWSLPGAVSAQSVRQLLDEHHDIACVVITSPTYAGVISDVSAIAAVCDAKHVPLIVDEAHGAHTAPELSALARGADLVVHSVHKTLGALTQVGLVHVSHRSLVPPHAVRACLTLLQTSSPSYLLLSSLEAALADVAGAGLSERLSMLRARCLQDLSGIDGVHVLGEEGGQRFAQDAAHLLVRMDGVEPEKLFDRCCQRGVFPESVLGTGALFLLGTGTAPADVMTLAQALASIAGTIERLGGSLPSTYALSRQKQQAQQVLSPRQAYLSQCEIVPLHEAIGRIAAECVAPCPPGTPVIVPGMRVMEEDVYSSRLTHLRVVVESGSRRS